MVVDWDCLRPGKLSSKMNSEWEQESKLREDQSLGSETVIMYISQWGGTKR